MLFMIKIIKYKLLLQVPVLGLIRPLLMWLIKSVPSLEDSQLQLLIILEAIFPTVGSCHQA